MTVDSTVIYTNSAVSIFGRRYAIGAVPFNAYSNASVTARLKWENISDTPESWTVIPDNSETWTPIN
jgi:hypothetical protein